MVDIPVIPRGRNNDTAFERYYKDIEEIVIGSVDHSKQLILSHNFQLIVLHIKSNEKIA